LLVASHACAIETTEVAERVLERAAAYRGSQDLPVQNPQAQLAAAARAFADGYLGFVDPVYSEFRWGTAAGARRAGDGALRLPAR
jgi:hypothetical protein